MPLVQTLALILLAGIFVSCDRNIEPFVPGEEPREPDLSQIFPEGASKSSRVEPGLPAPRGGPPPVAPAAAAGSADASGGEPVRGTIRLAEGLTPPQGAIGFLIARRGAGGPPLAVKRITDLRFPMAFEIGPADRMIASVPFTGPLTLTFRVDGDGNATSKEPGDLHGAAPAPVDVGAADVEIVIDESL